VFDHINVLLVGTGYMGKEYAKVLKSLNCRVTVVGRSEERCNEFREDFDYEVYSGGIQSYASGNELSSYHAIVAASIDQLYDTCMTLINKGVKKILLEKPGGLNSREVTGLSSFANEKDAKVYLAYNRRFYASVRKAEEIIRKDGGLQSISYEFTEWSSDIESLPHSAEVKEEWLLANSSHVIDLAFYLGGIPRQMSSYVKGSLPWHKRGAIYAGAGITDRDVLFSYSANWDAPGRWGLEFLTRRHRLYLRPMEKLSVQALNSVAIEPVEIDDRLDQEFKPGLYKQTKSFLNGSGDGRLLTLTEQAKHMKVYEAIESGAFI